jgi:hypothetical protein
MVKKSIIAIALIGMLATVSFAQDAQVPGQFKVDGKWPVTCTYTPVEICRIPVVLEVGMFIEIENCKDKKIVLKQVSCIAPQTFPCYKGCVTIKVRANFDAKLGLKLYKLTPTPPAVAIINGSNWKAYFSDGAIPVPVTADTWLITGNGNYQSVDVCVEAWDANIYAGTPGTQNPVGEVAVTAIPTAAIVCN